MHPALSSDDLARLRRQRPYPAVSVLMPTHRREPDNAQDPVRLRNLMAAAKERLRADPAVTRETRIDVSEQLDRALAGIDLGHAEDGLVVFAAQGEHEVWTLGRPVPERVVLSDTFLTRNLVSAQASERPFWVLAVASDRAALWSGTADRVTEEHADPFPMSRSTENFDAERRERIGDVPSTFRDEATRHFLREADTALTAVLKADPRPLYVTGEPAALALLDGVGTAAKGQAVHVPQGGVAGASADAVWQAVRPFVEARAEQEVSGVLQELDRARGRRAFAAGVDEIREHVQTGRVALLAVEENYRATVRDAGEHLLPAEPGDLDAVVDVVDEIVEKSLDTGADVRFVPDGALAGMGGIASALRY
ncbi:baeRF3 domain-containing protein [Streptomyces pacificus]|uniref:Chemotaxis protein n=1 Tax=Streptomyces pacificus TaxID=2705029 RepID=A0A6A0APX1_9ACTN|nr:chemotaxis protein [Streptomyces pacificus]GFH34535.1 chemotaxis protein [Streptomyces pacificus]